MSEPGELTGLLEKARKGDQKSSDEFVEKVYNELRQMAQKCMRSERSDHTLQPTALVSELYLRLFPQGRIDWQNHSHFFAVAAKQMRRILVDHARAQRRGKRGGDAIKVPLEDYLAAVVSESRGDLLLLDYELREFEKVDWRACLVIELHYFGGFIDKEIAQTLKISFATVRKDLDFAKAWLFRRLTKQSCMPADSGSPEGISPHQPLGEPSRTTSDRDTPPAESTELPGDD